MCQDISAGYMSLLLLPILLTSILNGVSAETTGAPDREVKNLQPLSQQEELPSTAALRQASPLATLPAASILQPFADIGT